MRYNTLYTVEILHDYFINGLAGQIVFTPTPACDVLLKGIGAFTKMWNNKLYVIAPTADGIVPFKTLPPEMVFEFYWQPADASFFSYTLLPVAGSKRYYCHNGIGAERNGKKYLHALPPAYNNTEAYAVGTFVSDAANNCFEALAKLNAGSTITDVNQWANRGPVAYLSQEQQIEFAGPIFTLPVQPSNAVVNVQIFGWNHHTNLPDKPVHAKVFNYEAAVSNQQIDLRGFANGLYRIVVNGQSNLRYIDADDNWHNQLGMISIYHNAALPAGNKLSGAAGKLLSPVYSIRLAPPSVIWQYKSRTAAVKKVEDETATFHFDNTSPTLFVSRLPIRLQQKPYDKLKLEYNNTTPIDPIKTVVVKQLPSAPLGPLQKITKNNTDYQMATIHLNY